MRSPKCPPSGDAPPRLVRMATTQARENSLIRELSATTPTTLIESKGYPTQSVASWIQRLDGAGLT